MQFLKTEIEKISGVRHGFFSRLGGTSAGLYDSLNCAWSAKTDDAAHVAENRARVARELGIAPENLATVSQVHSPTVVNVTQAWARGQAPQADGLVTATPGIAIGVLTADCAPVLFASRKGDVIGAAHAGWKGAVTGVLENTVVEMEKLGADRRDIVAAIGPCIGPQSYEVGPDFMQPFLEQDAGNAKFFAAATKPGHMIFNLPAYAAHRLRLAGVDEVHDTATDTLSDEKTYFSYRRSCLRQEADYGRQLSVIALVPR
jgi:polyphenol oxidase